VRAPAEFVGGKVKVTLSFAAWQDGNVAPATFEITVAGSEAKAKE
jgi:hypothetical protein